MKSLIIAEKPELAKSIVNAIDGKLNKNDGYFEKGNYVVTWASGGIIWDGRVLLKKRFWN